MLKIVLGFAAAASVAVAVGLGFGGNERGTPGAAVGPARIPDATEAVELLRDELRRERSARLALAARVARLEAEPRVTEAPAVESSPAGRDEPEVDVTSTVEPTGSFPAEQLIKAGFARADVEAYRERIDGIQLERLYLRDQAAREGWIDTPRFERASRELEQVLRDTRDEFGDELYDWTLYATGRPNRVRIAEVMDGSPAAEAGLEAGDILVRYGERAVFDPVELRQATRGGDAGESTAVEVVRNGERRRVFVPRGPLGIRLNRIFRRPAG